VEGTLRNHDLHRGDDILMHFIVEVRPAYRSSRWAWYVVDCESGETVECEFEYDSPLAARRAGMERLEELAASVDQVVGGTAGTSRLRNLLGASGRRKYTGPSDVRGAGLPCRRARL
jgi:hypothetical protein